MPALRISPRHLTAPGGLIGVASLIVACSDTTAPSVDSRVSGAAPSRPSAAVGAVSDMIVFERRVAAGLGEIHIVNPDGTGLTKLGIGESPSWSPDHTKITFVASGSIAVMNADGSNVRTVSSQQGRNRSPSFSPDGQTIVFIHENERDQTDIFVVNVDGSNERVLVKTRNVDEATPRFSPDGTKLAYATLRRGEIDVVVQDLATGRRTIVAGGTGAQLQPAWSPDGKRLAFRTSSGSAEDCIQIVNVDGTGRKNFPSAATGCDSPTWSPDGTELAFVTPAASGNVLRGTVDVAGAPVNVTLPAAGVVDQTPSWSR